ncbi:MAG: helix-turn-helix domain-containing protein [Ruminococcus flavefaciens]|nr:helix-turn-helix domain-containing protein [Ruminococcus flavefaciens]
MIKLKELRNDRQISMMQAAKELNIPYTTYVNYEKGYREPNSETLIQFAKYFNVPVDFLLGCSPFDFWEEINSNRAGFFYYVDIPADTLKVVWGIDKENPNAARTSDVINFLSACIKSVMPDDEGNWIIEYTHPLKTSQKKGQQIKKDLAEIDEVEIAKVALFSGSEEVTDDMWNEVVNFAKYIEARERAKNENN